jgi:predicted RNase H-like HicB family nuclease
MKQSFTAIVRQEGDWWTATCAEIPGANGMGQTREECLEDLKAAIDLIFEERRDTEINRAKNEPVSIEAIS